MIVLSLYFQQVLHDSALAVALRAAGGLRPRLGHS